MSRRKNEEVINQAEIESAMSVVRKRLKDKLTDWMDIDDQILELAEELKELKQKKQKREKQILSIYEKLGDDKLSFDILEEGGGMRGRVYRSKSKSTEGLKKDVIQEALKESVYDDAAIEQILSKIDSKRQVKERFYLKRTKGSAR